jgi:hypothetical protein
LAGADVIPDVHLGYCTPHAINEMHQAREPGCEAFAKFDGVLAPDIVAEHYPAKIVSFCQRMS